eukprot:1156759-Pelagomonas_calceolata.AAC.3
MNAVANSAAKVATPGAIPEIEVPQRQQVQQCKKKATPVIEAPQWQQNQYYTVEAAEVIHHAKAGSNTSAVTQCNSSSR